MLPVRPVCYQRVMLPAYPPSITPGRALVFFTIHLLIVDAAACASCYLCVVLALHRPLTGHGGAHRLYVVLPVRAPPNERACRNFSPADSRLCLPCVLLPVYLPTCTLLPYIAVIWF